MNALILEDEGPAARRLMTLLRDVAPDVTVIATLPSVENATLFFQNPPALDVVFSDIHLSDGLSFDIFRDVAPPAPIIFTTAYDEYALRAFKLNSVDYLLKPIIADELRAALDKLRARQPQPALDVASLLRALQPANATYRQRFLVSNKDALLPITADDVAYFFSENKVTRLVRPDGRWFPLPETLDELAEQLDPKRFFRANRQFIISVSSLGTIHRHFNGKLKLDLRPAPAEEVMVSRERADAFRQWLNQ